MASSLFCKIIVASSRMRSRIRNKLKILLVFVVSALVVYYFEVIAYASTSDNWVKFPPKRDFTSGTGKSKRVESLRILFVADPQLVGEEKEWPFLGMITRRDLDGHLRKTYSLAKNHVKPDVVIFLGDLFDEGSIATDSQYRRYYKRFQNIFDLPRKQNSSLIRYIFIPGDNDVGGTFADMVSISNVERFNDAFGDPNADEIISVKSESRDQIGFNVKFMKYNHFLQDTYEENPKFAKVEAEDYLGSIPTFRVLLTHYSVLRFGTDSTRFDTITKKPKSIPSLILSSHYHVSTHYKLEPGPQNVERAATLTQNFLAPTFSISQLGYIFQYFGINLSKGQGQGQRLDYTADDQPIHEIAVPTCSYRMGVLNIGYGYVQIFEDGTMNYTVLWLPSRYLHLLIYLGTCILLQIILKPW